MSTFIAALLSATILFFSLGGAQAQTITTSVGDRVVTVKLVQEAKKSLMSIASSDLAERRVLLNSENQKYFKDTLANSCTKPLFEVGCHRYSIVVSRMEKGQKIECTYCYNSDDRRAKIARNALNVFSMAVASAE